MFSFLNNFAIPKLLKKVFSKRKKMNVLEIKKEFSQKIYLELKEKLGNEEIVKIVLVYFGFLFKNNDNEIKIIFEILKLDEKILSPNCGFSLILVETQSEEKYFHILIINEEITERQSFLINYNDDVVKFFNNSYVLFETDSTH